MSFNGIISISSFNLLFFAQVLTVVTTTIKYNQYVTDKGRNISIPCEVEGSIMWVKGTGNDSTIIQTRKILVLTNVSEDDAGLYVCLLSEFNEVTSNNIKLDSSHSMNNETKISNISIDTENDESGGSNSSSNNSTVTQNDEDFDEMRRKNTSRNNSSSTVVIDFDHEHDDHQKNKSEYREYLKANLTVRTTPGPVSKLYFQASTILGFLVWRFNYKNSGGYPIYSFTAEYRLAPDYYFNETYEWIRLDPTNISPNVRQMEIYHLKPNTTYEFRIWANNVLGKGEIVTANSTTLPETKEEDLIRLILPDLEKFDPRIWIIAVGVFFSTLIVLSCGLCIVLGRECKEGSRLVEDEEDGCDSIELVPNIILNPGFCESDDQEQPYTRTIIFGEDDESDGYDESDEDDEPPLEAFKRKVSIFFTGHTIRRI